MHHMDFFIEIKDVLCKGGKVSIFQKSQLAKFYQFFMWVWL